MTDPQKNMQRRSFALAEAHKIREKLADMEASLWKEAAVRAKASGLYSPSTYIGDVSTGLRSHAGLRYLSLVRSQSELGGSQ